MATYTQNQRVEAIVERIFPFGVFVRLTDGTEAYIRRRELDLDADVDPKLVVHEGENITAVVINPISSGRLIELSRRLTLPDPWLKFAALFKEGDVVQGTVRELQSHGAFIRLQAGIDGFIPLDELAPRPTEKPEEVLWIGDDIEAIITRIIPARKKVSLSIRARMEKLDQAADLTSKISRDLAIDSKSTRSFHDLEDIAIPSTQLEDYSSASPVLIVEDDDTVRNSLKAWLSERRIEVFAAESASQANEITLVPVRISLIDLNLPDCDGLELIQSLRRNGNSGYVCVMSTPEDLADSAEQIQAARVTQVFAKPLDMDEINRLLGSVARGEQLGLWRIDTSKLKRKSYADSLRSIDVADEAFIISSLREITEMVQAQFGMVFWQDPASKTISIQYQVGETRINSNAIYGLRDSPVKDVIVEGEPIFENHVSNSLGKYNKLLELYKFQSCIGVPLPVQDEIHHAVFFFHSDEDAFPRFRQRDAQRGALLLSALLTDRKIREQLLSLNPVLLSGELAAGFGHDVFNKITGLELEARNLIDIGDDGQKRAQRILDIILNLKGTVQAFQQLLLRKELTEPINVHDVLEQSIQLILPLALKERTTIIQKLADEHLMILGNRIFLQQVFINIMLNAIQQMALKAERLGWKGKRVLEIASVKFNNQVQIRFQDNGPGIHKQSQLRLFTPGFSTRGGSGLGLYIAQGFIKKLCGRVVIEKSFVPLGTTFMVELPGMNQENDE